jgi:hypothetical protein
MAITKFYVLLFVLLVVGCRTGAKQTIVCNSDGILPMVVGKKIHIGLEEQELVKALPGLQVLEKDARTTYYTGVLQLDIGITDNQVDIEIFAKVEQKRLVSIIFDFPTQNVKDTMWVNKLVDSTFTERSGRYEKTADCAAYDILVVKKSGGKSFTSYTVSSVSKGSVVD